MVLAMSLAGWAAAMLFIVIWVALAFWPARVARRKGHSFAGYFMLSLFPLALIMATWSATVAASPFEPEQALRRRRS
jgi:hypothetical protein